VGLQCPSPTFAPWPWGAERFGWLAAEKNKNVNQRWVRLPIGSPKSLIYTEQGGLLFRFIHTFGVESAFWGPGSLLTM
jgi:hypothetical protein